MHPESLDARQGITDEITAAVTEYERSLALNDLEALNSWFWDSPQTIRADLNGVLVGRDAIDAFRRSGPGALPRAMERLHVVPLTDTTAVAVAETRREDGTRGLQTQVWIHTAEGWKISAAHVSVNPRAEAVVLNDQGGSSVAGEDASVWRVQGRPLVAGASRGPLSGCTVAVKDTYAVAGHAVGAGNPQWLAAAPLEQGSAFAVQALLNAGADVVGLAQTDEFAYSLSGTNLHYGTPPNPAAKGRVPGGSSSGPASAVASEQADIGLGSDTAGSIRVPASYCGLFGLRPSHGVISTEGMLPLAPEFDTVGWLTRDWETLVAVAKILLPEDTTAAPSRVLLAEDLFQLADAAVQPALHDAVDKALAQLGMPHEMVPKLAGDQLDDWVAAFGTVQAARAWKIYRRWLTDHPGALEPEIAQRFANGQAVTEERLRESEQVLSQARTLIEKSLPPGTVMLQPAASSPAPPPTMSQRTKAAMRAGTLRLTCAASIAGLPAVTIPAAHVQGLPVGLCLVGSRGSDRALAALAGVACRR